MEFKNFAKKLKTIIGGGNNTKRFTKTLFETMMNESGPELLKHIKIDTYKSYFNGYTSISNISEIVLSNLNEDDEFISYIEGFGDTTAQLLADEFIDEIPDINASNAAEKINSLFLDILREASGSPRNKKSTHKGAKNEEKSSNDIISEKILASGQALSDAWGKAISNLADELNENNFVSSIQLPEEQVSESPYSVEDNLLLQEFTTDYDEIMVTLIGENYAISLIDMSLPCKIKDLYETKWISKADSFSDPTLKSYIFGLLGELNNISNSFLFDTSDAGFSSITRAKIRNLYVNLHPEQYSGAFPYDAFIDDWNDGDY